MEKFSHVWTSLPSNLESFLFLLTTSLLLSIQVGFHHCPISCLLTLRCLSLESLSYTYQDPIALYIKTPLHTYWDSFMYPTCLCPSIPPSHHTHWDVVLRSFEALLFICPLWLNMDKPGKSAKKKKNVQAFPRSCVSTSFLKFRGQDG